MLTLVVSAKHEGKSLDRSTRVRAKTVKEAIEFAISFLAKTTKTRKNGWIAYGIKFENNEKSG